MFFHCWIHMQIQDGLQCGLLLLFHSFPSPKSPLRNKTVTHSGKESLSVLPGILDTHSTSLSNAVKYQIYLSSKFF